MIDFQPFRVAPDSNPSLAALSADQTGGLEEEGAKAMLEALRTRLRELHELFSVEGKHSLLICLQAMDAGGKDGVISHVFDAMRPQSCRVVSFGEPSKEEAGHDFLWRAHRHTPASGEIAVFNRSHYEGVLVERVRGLVPEAVWEKRYRHINDFERMLTDGHTHILKFFLHISKEEQWERFRKRLDDPMKHGKLRESDFTDRQYWDEYQRAFEAMLARCSTNHAPWFVIPSDRKWFRNLAVAQILVDFLEGLAMQPPAPPVDIESLRRKYFT